MRKIVAEDSDRHPFYIERDDNAPEEQRYIITGALLPSGAPIKAPTIPDAMQALREFMRGQERLLVTYDMEPGNVVYSDRKGRITHEDKNARTRGAVSRTACKAPGKIPDGSRI